MRKVAELTGLEAPLHIVLRTSTNLKAWEVIDAKRKSLLFDRSSNSIEDGWAEVLRQVSKE
jgi:hypothetical protein